MRSADTLLAPVGRHQFTVYEGDVEYVETDEGLLVPANPVVFESGVVKNLIVTAGKNLLLDRLFNLAAAVAITSVGVGDSATAAVVGQTGLIGTTNVLLQTADAGTARASQTVTIKSTFGTGVANFTWNEAGLFNGNTNNTSTMFNRVVIGPFTKSSAVSIIYTATVTQS